MSAPRADERGGLEILAEAAHLLRAAPPAAHLVYLAGTVPFLFALLDFVGTMSRSGVVRRELPVRALVLALLYVAMKTAHAFFCRALLAARRTEAGAAPSVVRVALTQAALQPSSLFLLPLAALVTVPYGWALAFYNAASALGAWPEVSAAAARRQAALWPRQAHVIAGLLVLLRAIAFLNTLALVLVLPLLARMLLGVETVFSRSGAAVLNSTTLAVALALAHLLVDPLAKAAYALRAFHGLSVATGEDLRAALREASRAAAVVLALLVLAAPATAAPAPPQGTSVSPEGLSRSVDAVLSRAEYRWRAPSDAPEEGGALLDVARAIDAMARRAVRAVARSLNEISEWIGKLVRPKKTPAGSAPARLPAPPKSLLVVLFLASAAVVLFLLRGRRAPGPLVVAEAAEAAPPDVLDERVTADARPADGWLELAKELLAQGDGRRALRALYLAALAQLSARGLLVLAAHKSNGEYARELARRSVPRLVPVFREVVSDFDASWYGRHEVNRELLDRTLANVEALRAGS